MGILVSATGNNKNSSSDNSSPVENNPGISAGHNLSGTEVLDIPGSLAAGF